MNHRVNIRGGSKEKSHRFSWPILLSLVWVLMIIIVNPVGNFPLNDDWAYGYSVRNLVEHGELRFSDWTATNLLGQVIWGALFCMPFGFSFMALRMSTAVLGLVGVLATYGILRELRTTRETAFIGALTLAFCPIYFALSLTFMNDVPFAAFASTSIYLFLRGMRLDSRLTIAAGLLLASVAILTRQTGLALPIAFACALLAKKGIQPRYLLLAFVLVATGVAIQFAYQTWLMQYKLAPAKFNNQIFSLLANTRTGRWRLVRDSIRISFFCLTYVGLFILPVLPFLFLKSPRDGKVFRRTSLAATAITLIFVTAGLIWVGKLMPLWRNILDEGGIGPCSMLGSKILPAPLPFWAAVTGLSLVGSVGVLRSIFLVIVASYSRFRRRNSGQWPLVLLLSLIAMWFAPLPLLGLGGFGFYDRYVIVFVFTTIAMLAGVEKRAMLSRPFLVTSFVLLMAYGAFSVAATHDYLAWNRARWTALHDLMREAGIPPSHIYGGGEFNGWYLYDQYSGDPKRRWFWAENDDYVVSFTPLDEYQVLKRYAVQRWLPWQRHAGDILVQRRIVGKSRSG
jgi:4-amino-4-deoxy-L-arabinose transferase-like glycosyltransferase